MFDASSAFSSAAVDILFSDVSTSDNSGYVWVWMTVVPIGFYSAVSVVSNAVDCYNFVAAWNMISRTHRMDVEISRFRKNAAVERRRKLEKALDTRPYGDVFFPKEGSCPICLGDFCRSDIIGRTKGQRCCKHIFHKECIAAWLSKHSSCPCCRHEILPLPKPPKHALLVSN